MKKTITILLFLCMMFNTIIFADTAQHAFSIGYATATSYIYSSSASANVNAPSNVYTTMTMTYKYVNIYTGLKGTSYDIDYGYGWRGVYQSAPTNCRSVYQSTAIQSSYGDETWNVTLCDSAQ